MSKTHISDRILTQLEKELLLASGIDNALVRALKVLFSYHDPYTASHQLGVAHLAIDLGTNLGLSCVDKSVLYAAALLHDVGKIAIPIQLLTKPGPITKEERDLLRSHVTHSAAIGTTLQLPEAIVATIADHHERIDGSGYPTGKTDVPYLSQILSVVDVVDSMKKARPYRKSLPWSKVAKELISPRYDQDIILALPQYGELVSGQK